MSNNILLTILEYFYKPKWKKDADMLDKAAKRFINYKRDLLEPESLTEIEARRKDLLISVRRRDQKMVLDAGNRLENACESSLAHTPRPSAFAENIEVFFVAIVIALGIRAYIVQPFRIPTGSMQPSLNGITGESIKKKDWPILPFRMLETITKGRTYIEHTADRDLTLLSPDLRRSMVETQRFNFFTYTYLYFKDGSSMSINAPRNVLLNDFNFQTKFGIRGKKDTKGNPYYEATQLKIPKDTVIASGYSQSGDLILVDKFSYHFRKPDRGETFVFDTRGIQDIHRESGPQGAGSHYIKRLAGIPGDTLSIGGTEGSDGKLYIDGSIAKGQGFKRVMDQEGVYGGEDRFGYVLANSGPRYRLTKPGNTLYLKKDKAAPLMKEYAALGDNTTNSLDSRYWGPVKEYNLVGPALFSLWPFTTGHWGFIE